MSVFVQGSKKKICLWIDKDVLEKVKADAKSMSIGYQTWIGIVLKQSDTKIVIRVKPVVKPEPSSD